MKKARDIIILSLIAIPIGAIIGAITSLFGQVLLAIGGFRDNHARYLIPFLAIAGLISVLSYEKLGGKSKEGMSLLIKAGCKKEDKIPLQLIPLIIGGTWLTHLFGGSAGREGVAVQIGGTLSYNIGKRVKLQDAPEILLISGMAGGFAGLFQTPLASIMFAFEVMAIRELRYRAILPSITSAFTACWISSLLGLEKFSVDISETLAIKDIWKLLILGAILGLTGCAFAFILGKAKALAKKITNPYIRIGTISIILSIVILLVHDGRYAGLGTNLISEATSGGAMLPYDFALKFVLTIITLSAGFQGGEVTPLYSIGASLGAVLAPILNLPIPLCASLGYCAVFGSATNTLVAPMLIFVEVFGIASVPQAIIVCSIAYIINFNQSIYMKTK